MAYIVQGMTLIPQNLNMSCWYASATMLIQWKMDQRQQSIGGLIPPELDAECQKIKDDNKGIANPQILKMAKRLGLEAIPPMTAPATRPPAMPGPHPPHPPRQWASAGVAAEVRPRAPTSSADIANFLIEDPSRSSSARNDGKNKQMFLARGCQHDGRPEPATVPPRRQRVPNGAS